MLNKLNDWLCTCSYKDTYSLCSMQCTTSYNRDYLLTNNATQAVRNNLQINKKIANMTAAICLNI